MDIHSENTPKMIKRLNATLPEPLARFVGEMTGDGGLYETPSEFVRDLIRRYMENMQKSETNEINQLLMQSIAEKDYSPLSSDDFDDIRKTLED